MMRRKVKQLLAAGMALAVLATNLTPLSFAAERADAEPAAAAGVETYDARAKRDWEYTGCLWSNDNKTVIFNYKNKKDGSTQSVTVNSTAHKMKSPTCTEEGKTRYTATVYSWDALDGQMREREKTVPVPKLDHTYPATPEEIVFVSLDNLGNKPTAQATYRCTRCKETKTETVTDLTYVEVKKATCTEGGEGYWVAKAGSKTVNSAHVHPKKTDHDFTKKDADHVTFDFAENGKTAVATIRCDHCNAIIEKTVTCTAEVTTPATCTEMGTTTYTATYGAARDTTTRKDVPALDHSYGNNCDVQWDDSTYKTATLIWECDNEGCDVNSEGHFKSQTLTAVEKVTKPATCTDTGRLLHEVSYEFGGETEYLRQTTTIPALGHDFTQKDAAHVTFAFAQDGKTAVATIQCGRCDVTTTENVTCTAEVTTPATCTEMGTTTYTAACGTASETTTRQDVPALGHRFTDYSYDNNAVCTEDGTETAKCDRCDATDTRTASGTAHCALHLVDGAQVCPVCGKVDGSAALNAVSADFDATPDTVGLRLVVRVGSLPSGKRIMTVVFVDGRGCMVPVSGICKVRVSLANVKAQLGESDVADFTHTLTLLNAADGAKTDVGYALENGTLIFDARFDGRACLLQID